ncbi:MAG: hypothetical protein IPN69_09815 [Acidobacteria bacterium]|nr:hypothetical protein [Acidobacteriota bacterium]MBK8811013.1 hypothetical protein [Acidobacteriota bacterium]
MSIIKKVEEKRTELMASPTQAEAFGKLCAKALRGGLGSDEWKTVANEYVENQADLDKLMFVDPVFCAEEWAEVAVGYVIGGGVCTIPSARDGGTRRTMNDEIERILG